MTRRYEFSRVGGGGGLRQVLRNALRIAKKREKRKKSAQNRAITSERYVTGKGGVKPFVTKRYIG